MGKRISPSAIGIFVVGSFALVIAAIIVVGGGSMFRKPHRFVCMFAGDVNGLKIGAPVKFKGVQIGTVEEIKIVLAPGEGQIRPDITDLRLPVIIGIDRQLIAQRGGNGQALTKEGFEAMITRGMRAQLQAESLLTGLLYVDLDLHPNTPVHLVIVPGSGNLTEIPTVPTTMAAIQKQATDAIAKLDKIDFDGLVTSITQAANSIKEVTSDPALRATIASLKQTVTNLNETLTSVRAAVNNANGQINPLVASLRKSSDEANATMKDTRATLLELQSTLEPDSPLSVHLNEALDQLADTTRSVEQLTNYLQRNPAALIRGKYVPEKDR
ncbi:MAG TPA: MlaD family protein [Candidatus Acidoferrales bacterium]|nr:MlaD family protein [Candidatus Acidoferrales bacterium]